MGSESLRDGRKGAVPGRAGRLRRSQLRRVTASMGFFGCAPGREFPRQPLPVLVAALALGAILLPRLPAGAQSGPKGPPLTSECTVRTRGWLQPGLVAVGDLIHVATHVTFTCPERRQTYHLVLVIDRSLWNETALRARVETSCSEVLDALALYRHPDVAVGVVAYSDQAELVCGLDNEGARLRDCLQRLTGPVSGQLGGRALDQALYEARKALLVGRERLDRAAPQPLREAVLVVAWPPPDESLGAAVAAAAELRRSGVEVATVNESAVAEADPFIGVANPGQAYSSRDWPAVLASEEQRAWSTWLRIREASIHEFLSRGIRPVPESADPTNPGYDAERNVLEWVLPLGGQDAIHVSYSARATGPGRQPLRQLGYGVFRDSYGLRGAFTLPSTELVVVEGRIQQAYVPLAGRFGGGSIKTAASRQ